MNLRQKAFVDTYIAGLLGEKLSAPQAYLKVYRTKSLKVAGRESHRILQRPEVKEYIQQKMSELAMSGNEVLVRLAEIARNGTNTEKLKALELIGKVHGLFTERVDVTSGGEKLSFKEFIQSYGNIRLPG
ncbi:phage terminase, small subunit [Anaerolinea thermolimosa]|uniref:terminase small subunit n=1 Tax=Anaerolinea thermolimosa TaxID=229919 RepID=UPI0007848376|nr:terminase small subunit [Anaerolinea thermolimosa]GAP07116.1 phage terminase, small subunit [Anaerolinea thermolimosa]